jgi:hypothetical protein
MEMVEAKQYGERVNIVKYVRLEKKWRFAAVVEKRGRVIRDQVWIARRREYHPEGRYFLEWTKAGNVEGTRLAALKTLLMELAAKRSNWGPSEQASFVPRRNPA